MIAVPPEFRPRVAVASLVTGPGYVHVSPALGYGFLIAVSVGMSTSGADPLRSRDVW